MAFNFLTYNKFKKRKWKRLSPNKRLKIFQKLENIQAKKLKRPVCTIRTVDWAPSERMNGQFLVGKNIIELNYRFIYEDNFRFYGMATLFHEGRHAQQYHVCFSGTKVRRFSKAYKWKQNLLGYVNGENDKFSFYSMQPVERDANKYASNRLKKFKNRFCDDPIFERTLQIKIEEFEETETNARKELGIFYKFRISQRTKKQQKKNEKR